MKGNLLLKDKKAKNLVGKIDWPHREIEKGRKIEKKKGLTVSILRFGQLVLVVGTVLLITVVQHNNLPAFLFHISHK